MFSFVCCGKNWHQQVFILTYNFALLLFIFSIDMNSVVDPQWFQGKSGSKALMTRHCFTEIFYLFIPRPPWRMSELQIWTSSTSKQEFFPFPNFVGNFCPPGSGSGSSRPKINADPDPKTLDMTVHKCVNQVTVPWPAWDAGLEVNGWLRWAACVAGRDEKMAAV
jgi:hypothetical protein